MLVVESAPMADLSITVSLVSLVIASVTMWLTLLRRGNLRMTKPTIIFFGFDFQPKVTAKIFLRTLLYSTSARGIVIEGMYAKVKHAASEEMFGFWGYGERNALVPGSGLYVGQNGVGANHHFVLSVARPPYEFTLGEYFIEIYARVVGQRKPLKLSEIQIVLSEKCASALAAQRGVLFESSPDDQRYIGHIEEPPR